MNDETPDIEKTAQDLSEKLNVDIDWARRISPDELLWLLDHCPFLQIINTEVLLDKEEEGPKIITAESSGWDIHVYVDAMSSSPGKFLFGGGDFRILTEDDDDDGGEGGEIVNPGKGTIFNQAFMTAAEMVSLAKRLGWTMIQIVDGHPRMVRAAWIKASELGLDVEGFSPSEYDEAVRKRVNLSSEEMQSLRKKMQSGR